MNPESSLISVSNADSGLHDDEPRCCATAEAIAACTDLDALQDLIRQRCDGPD